MLALLRKLRKSMIDTGSTRTYLLYAVGEIALVVIGILIALQINNWNEQRKDIKEGNRYIHLIYRDLLKEKEQMNNNITRLTAQNKGFYDLAVMLEDTPGNLNAEEFEKGVIAAYTPIKLDRQELTWDELISSGRVDIIRDDSLELQLKSYYQTYDLDILTFNEAPAKALQEFQRLALRSIDVEGYERAFSNREFGALGENQISQFASDQEFMFLVRELLVGSKVLINTLSILSERLDMIIAYIKDNYLKD